MSLKNNFTREEVLLLLSKMAVERTCNHCDEPSEWTLENNKEDINNWLEHQIKIIS